MAALRTFNPPPNWPTPPTGWQPPQGWQPDPTWGPPPPGWALWTEGRANPRAWNLAFISAGAWWAVFCLLGVVVFRSVSAQGFGAIAAPAMIAGLVTALIARSSSKRWATWVYPLAVLGFFLVLNMLSAVGRMSPGA